MKLIRKDQICAFNIHYAYYSLEYCLNSLEKLGVTKVELLAGHPGLWLDHRGFEDTRPIRRMLADRHIQCPVITPENCEFAYQYGAPEKNSSSAASSILQTVFAWARSWAQNSDGQFRMGLLERTV